MLKLAFLAVFGLILAGCASDRPERAGSGATAAPPGATNPDMRGSSDTAPGAEGDRRRPQTRPSSPRY